MSLLLLDERVIETAAVLAAHVAFVIVAYNA